MSPSLFFCTHRHCGIRGVLVEVPWRDCGNPECCRSGGTHYPTCPQCGSTMRENVSAPNVIWTGPIGQRYRSKEAEGFHNPDGMIVYEKNTPDGKPRPVHLNDWGQVKDFCRREGLRDPRENGNNIQVAENGRDLINTMGMPGTEV